MPDPSSPAAPEIAAPPSGPDPGSVLGTAPHSSRQLLRSTIIAAVVAAVLLVTVVMPAEYGRDPTGAGRLLGLTSMGEIKQSLAEEARAAAQAEDPARILPATSAPTFAEEQVETQPSGGTALSAPPPGVVASASDPTPAVVEAAEAQALVNAHVTEIALAPNQGKEVKLVMTKGARVTYSWSTDRGVVNYDTHADAPGIKYHGYAKGSGEQSDEGVLEAAFDGAHGWFWRNRGSEKVTVTLTTNGQYLELKRF